MPAIDRIFVDIDTQFDFLDPAGKLYVPGAVEIIGQLERLFTFAKQAKIPVLSSTDDHPPGDPEFAQFGPHCLRGAPGQEKLPFTILTRSFTIQPDETLPNGAISLLDDYDQLIFPKATLDAFDNPHFAALIETLEVSEFVVFGVATEYCVLKAVEGFLARDNRVTIVCDAIRSIDAQVGQGVCRMLIERGALWATTADIMGVTA